MIKLFHASLPEIKYSIRCRLQKTYYLKSNISIFLAIEKIFLFEFDLINEEKTESDKKNKYSLSLEFSPPLYAPIVRKGYI